MILRAPPLARSLSTRVSVAQAPAFLNMGGKSSTPAAPAFPAPAFASGGCLAPPAKPVQVRAR